MSDRLMAIDWMDYAAAERHALSRALLMREFLRRSALWVEYLGGGDRWPFIDFAECVDPSVRADEGLMERLDAFTSANVPDIRARRMCRAATRWTAIRDETQVRLPDLEDPYAPLVMLYERGGAFWVENGVADFELRRVPLRTWQANVSPEPVVPLDRAALDALDSEAESGV
ncbi:hypothetical protein [Streptomyces triculaminicus]|uniref:hypothetical protein n=1 Tax=Streptomyces triculaminicus TaxID=2816232 RepID=UPI0037D45A4E